MTILYGDKSLYIIVIAVLIIIILSKLSTLSKRFCRFRSKLIGLFTRYRIFVMTKFIVKNRVLLQFFADFFLFWLVFLWNDGIVIQSALDFVQPLRDKALAWSVKTDLWDMRDWNELLIILFYFSPYGRAEAFNLRFQYALNISTICSIISLILYIMIINDMAKQSRCWRMLIGVVSGIATWYAGYFMCSAISEIPFFTMYLHLSLLSYHILLFSFLSFSFGHVFNFWTLNISYTTFLVGSIYTICLYLTT